MAADLTFLQKLRHDLGFFRRVESHLASSQAVVFISEKIIQRNYHVVSGHVSGNVIRVSNTYVRGCIRRNIGDHIIVNISIICVKPQVYRDIGIQFLEIFNSLFINVSLGLICIVFCPEGDLIVLGGVESFRDSESCSFFLPAVTAGKRGKTHKDQKYCCQNFSCSFHPLIPPWDTPAMIFRRNTRNRMINGTEITTTAAIMAGIFSRPNPFSRISWIPLDTR